jgi:hypothetical protein
MISFTSLSPNNPSDSLPFTTPEAKGLLMYNSHNFMLCLIHEPDGSNMHSYGRPVTVEQDGERIVVVHHVEASNLVDRIGTLQRRVPSFGKEDGEEIVTVRTDGPVDVGGGPGGEEWVGIVKWRRVGEGYGKGTGN